MYIHVVKMRIKLLLLKTWNIVWFVGRKLYMLDTVIIVMKEQNKLYKK